MRDELVAFGRNRRASPAVPRRDTVVLRILDTLASDPVLTAESVSTRLEVSPAAAHRALTELAAAGILGRGKERGRLVCWPADRHLARGPHRARQPFRRRRHQGSEAGAARTSQTDCENHIPRLPLAHRTGQVRDAEGQPIDTPNTSPSRYVTAAAP